MADNKTNYDDGLQADTIQADGTEPATSHDVKEGGILGAVGGAIVGLLAGGPVGAVIGAVAGGAASAAAVNVVDKHDHDYAATTADNNDTASNAGTQVSGTVPSQMTEAAPYAAISAPVGRGVHTQDTDGEVVVPIIEEELAVGKREVQSGGARIRTDVVETPVEESVLLREEHLTVDRRPVDRAATGADTAFQEKSFEVTETAEVPVVTKTARVVEEVVVGKAATDRVETIHDSVRRTEVEVEDLGADSAAKR